MMAGEYVLVIVVDFVVLLLLVLLDLLLVHLMLSMHARTITGALCGVGLHLLMEDVSLLRHLLVQMHMVVRQLRLIHLCKRVCLCWRRFQQ